MTKQELIDKWKKKLESDREFLEGYEGDGMTWIYLRANYEHDLETLEAIIEDLEKLDQPKIAILRNDLRNSFLHMADEIS